jgi:hypothetical protein
MIVAGSIESRWIPASSAIGVWSGLGHPIAFYLIRWAFFGILLILFLEHHNQLQKALGLKSLCLTCSRHECRCLCVWRYSVLGHVYLSVSSSAKRCHCYNGLICLRYYALQIAKITVKLFPRTSESFTSQYVLAAALRFSVITTTLFLSSVINLVWYVWVSPWRENSQSFWDRRTILWISRRVYRLRNSLIRLAR